MIKNEEITPGTCVFYRNKPMVVLRVGKLWREEYAWLAPRDLKGPSLDDVLRVPMREVETE